MNYESIDDKLARLDLSLSSSPLADERPKNPLDAASAPNSPPMLSPSSSSLSVKKKRAARAYHSLSPTSPGPTSPQFSPPLNFTPQYPLSPASPSSTPFSPLSPSQRSQFAPNSLLTRSVLASIPATTGRPYIPDDSLLVPALRSADQDLFFEKPFLTFQNTCPPQATTQHVSVDQGTASSKLITASLYNAPVLEKLRSEAGLPLAIHVTPFAEPVENALYPAVRCSHCRGYILATGQRSAGILRCALCQGKTPVQEYPESAPEVRFGAVDFVFEEVTEASKGKPGAEPAEPMRWVFAIDVSASLAQRGIVLSTCEALRAALDSLPEGVRVAILTFDRHIHYYRMLGDMPVSIVDLDPDNPVVPFSSGIFVDPQEQRGCIEQTLHMIENTEAGSRYLEVSYGCALRACLALLGKSGGKVTCSLSMVPNFEAGALSSKKYEEASKLDDEKKERAVLQPNNKFYTDLAKQYVDQHVGLDLFVLPTFEVDLINCAHVSFATGGLLKLFNGFDVEKDERLYISDYISSVTNTIGYQAHIKVRCSTGLEVQKYYGNFLPSDNPSISILSKDTCFDTLFRYTGRLNTSLDCHFQAVVLYTTLSGERRLRVVNLVTAVTERLLEVFAFANQDALVSLMVRDCVDHIGKQSVELIKELVDQKIVKFYLQYRKNIVPEYPAAQFVVPQSISTLAAYMLGFTKQKSMRPLATPTKTNTRVFNMYQLRSAPLRTLSYVLYPYIVGLHSLGEQECEYNEIYNKYVLPKGENALLLSIEVGGCYFAFNGNSLLLWVHPDANPQLFQDLFGVENFSDIDPYSAAELPELDTQISKQARTLVKYFTEEVLRTLYVPVKVLRFNLDDPAEFLELFLEDKSLNGARSYAEYLSIIHSKVKK